jgi:hypothetical protein
MMKNVLMPFVVATVLAMAAGDTRAEGSKTIRDLRKEQIATLQQAADLLAAEYKNERRTYDEVFDGRLLLAQAKLDAAETGPERVKQRQSIVDLMKEREAFFVDALKFEKVDALKVLNVKADRLKAEIALEEAKGTEGKKGK